MNNLKLSEIIAVRNVFPPRYAGGTLHATISGNFGFCRRKTRSGKMCELNGAWKWSNEQNNG